MRAEEHAGPNHAAYGARLLVRWLLEKFSEPLPLLRFWFGESLQRISDRRKQIRGMSDGNVIDLVVVNLSVTVCQYISETDNVPRMRNFLRDRGSHFIEAGHRFAANFQDAL